MVVVVLQCGYQISCCERSERSSISGVISIIECCCVVNGSDDMHIGGANASREPSMPSALQRQHQQFLGDASSVVLDLGTVQVDDNELLPEGITVEHLGTFELMYITHCEVNLIPAFPSSTHAMDSIIFWGHYILPCDKYVVCCSAGLSNITPLDRG